MLAFSRLKTLASGRSHSRGIIQILLLSLVFTRRRYYYKSNRNPKNLVENNAVARPDSLVRSALPLIACSRAFETYVPVTHTHNGFSPCTATIPATVSFRHYTILLPCSTLLHLPILYYLVVSLCNDKGLTSCLEVGVARGARERVWLISGGTDSG